MEKMESKLEIMVVMNYVIKPYWFMEILFPLFSRVWEVNMMFNVIFVEIELLVFVIDAQNVKILIFVKNVSKIHVLIMKHIYSSKFVVLLIVYLLHCNDSILIVG